MLTGIFVGVGLIIRVVVRGAFIDRGAAEEERESERSNNRHL